MGALVEPEFRRDLMPLWLKGCEWMRRKLGAWRDFQDVSARRLGDDSVLVIGRASFTAGEYAVDIYWHIAGGRAWLYYLFLKGPGGEVSIPMPIPREALPPADLPPRDRIHAQSGFPERLRPE